MKKNWLLSKNHNGSKVKLNCGGMTVFEYDKNNVSVGYTKNERLENLRLISSCPELHELVLLSHKILKENNIKNNEFESSFLMCQNKINGKGEIQKPHYLHFFEWDDKIDSEKYHNSLKNLNI